MLDLECTRCYSPVVSPNMLCPGGECDESTMVLLNFLRRLLKDVSVADNCLNTSTNTSSRVVRRTKTLPGAPKPLLQELFGKENFGKENVFRSQHKDVPSRFNQPLGKKPHSTISPSLSSDGSMASSASMLSDSDSRDSGLGLLFTDSSEVFTAPSHPPPRRVSSPLKKIGQSSSLRRLDSTGSYFGSGSSNSAGSSISTSVTDEDEVDDGFLDVFDMDAMDSEGPFSLGCSFPSGIHQLLKAPLASSSSSEETDCLAIHLSDSENHSTSTFLSQSSSIADQSPKRPPIRRCLSMVMESPLSPRVLSPKNILLKNVDRNNNSCAPLRRPEDTRKRLLQDEVGEDAFKKPCEPPFCAGVHRARDHSPGMACYEAKRRKSVTFFTKSPSDTMAMLPNRRALLQRSHSEAEAALQRSTHDPNLIGDCSGAFALPLVKGRHDDLKTITPDTLSMLLEGKFDEKVSNYKIVDCRYPYEFEGGHIKGACNFYSKEAIIENMIKQSALSPLESKSRRDILVFHCEFSSERGPNLCRFLRNKDREANKDNYPNLFHPEIYLLEGGYKDFFIQHKHLCIPQDYRPMLHKDHESDLRKFRAKSKSWSGDTKSRTAVRPGLKL